MTEPRAPLDLPWYLSAVLVALRKCIGLYAWAHRDATPLMDLTWLYLNRVPRRFEALLRKVQSGQEPAAVRPRTRPAAGPDDAPRVRKPELPRRFGWLSAMVVEVRGYRGQVRHFLTDPGMVALFATDPRFGALLRPLCRMMGISAKTDPDLPACIFKFPGTRTPAAPSPTLASPAAKTRARPPRGPEWPPTPSPEPRAQPQLPQFSAKPA